MKLILCFLVTFSSLAFGETWTLKTGHATYEVKHLMKTVSGDSGELKGKILCSELECEFLIAVPVKSFTSSDSNRDQNMIQTTEAVKYPYTTAKGKISRKQILAPGKSHVPVEIEFHGKKAKYQAEINVINTSSMQALLNIDLDQHGVERPSLFGIKISEKVPLTFKLAWEKN